MSCKNNEGMVVLQINDLQTFHYPSQFLCPFGQLKIPSCYFLRRHSGLDNELMKPYIKNVGLNGKNLQLDKQFNDINEFDKTEHVFDASCEILISKMNCIFIRV